MVVPAWTTSRSVTPLSTTDPLMRTEVWVAAAEDTALSALAGAREAMWLGPVGLGVAETLGEGLTLGDGTEAELEEPSEDPPTQPVATDATTARMLGPSQRHVMAATLGGTPVTSASWRAAR
jgi:hypothetical protein